MYKWMKPGRWPHSQRPLFNEQTGALDPDALGAGGASPAPAVPDYADFLAAAEAKNEQFFNAVDNQAQMILDGRVNDYRLASRVLAQGALTAVAIARLQGLNLRAAIQALEEIRERVKAANNG